MEKLKGEIVRIKTSDNLELQGILYEPVQATNTAIIHVHGWTGNFYENYFLDQIAADLIKNNISFLSFNTRGAGFVQDFYKIENGKKENVQIGGCLEVFEDCLFDLDGAVNYLTNRGYKNFYLQGHSTGCQKVVYYALNNSDKNIKGLILLEPTDDPEIVKTMLGDRYQEALDLANNLIKDNKPDSIMPDWIKFGIKLSPHKFLSMSLHTSAEGKLFNYSGDLKEIKSLPMPIITIFATNTEYQANPKEVLDLLQNNLQHPTTVLIPDTNHGFTGKETELSKNIMDWILH